MEQHNDETLMLLYGAGELQRFQVLFDNWRHAVYRYLYHLVREDAEAVYQATWLKFIERRAEFTENSRFKPWLFGIAHGQLMENLTARRMEKIMEVEDAAVEISSHNLHELHFRSRFEQGLMEAISALPAPMKEAFLLSEEGLTIEEIAEAVCVSNAVATSRLEHAHAIVIKTLSAWGVPMGDTSETWKTIRDVERNDILDDQLLATSKLPDWPPKLVNLDVPAESEAEDKSPTSIWSKVRPSYAIAGLLLSIAVGAAFFASVIPATVKREFQQAKSVTKKASQPPAKMAEPTIPPAPSLGGVKTAPLVDVSAEAARKPRAKVAAKPALKRPKVDEVTDEALDDAQVVADDASAKVTPEPAPPQPPKMVWVRQPDNTYWKDSIPIGSAPFFIEGSR